MNILDYSQIWIPFYLKYFAKYRRLKQQLSDQGYHQHSFQGNTVKTQSCTWESISNKNKRIINICHPTTYLYKAEIFLEMTIILAEVSHT